MSGRRVQHVLPRRRSNLMPTGAVAEAYPRGGPAANSAGMTGILTSQTLMLWAIDLEAGVLVSTLNYRSGTQAAVAPTNYWAVFCDANRVVRAVSADKLTEAWAGETDKAFAMAAAYRTPTLGRYYYGLMVKAGTVPAIYGVTDAASSSGLAGIAPITAGASGTGLTTPPSVGDTMTALTAKIQKAYCWIT